MQTLSTPSAMIDVLRMQANLENMQQRMNGLGVSFRPHVKTSKCFEVVKRQLTAGAKGITVSTLKEARQFFAQGISDILYGVGITATKLPVAANLIAEGCNLKIITDSVDSAKEIAAFADANGTHFEVLVEIDSDGHRSGVAPNAPELPVIASILEKTGSKVVGVLTHAGSSYNLHERSALERLAEQEKKGCVQAAEHLRTAGFACPMVSVGSTPTALSAIALDEVTEVRAGVYIFFDLVMLSVGVCSMSDIALSVLTTVIGHQKEKGWAITDAGWMAMSRDRGTAGRQVDYGYGQVCDIHCNPIQGYTVSSANQEHGIISRTGTVDTEIAKRFPTGTRLRILPNHACATGAQFPEYHAVNDNGEIEVWPRFYGW